jgi:tetratricopeptide (TPR) repeat protein
LILALAGCANQEAAQEHFDKGNELAKAQQFEQAIVEFQAALDEDPEFTSAMVNMGVAYYQLARLDEAIAQYEKAIELEPEDADIHSNLAAAYVQMNQLDQALEEYLLAVELNPELAEAYFGLGVIYAQGGKIDEAIQAIERFQELDTGSDPKATELAQQYLQQLKGP